MAPQGRLSLASAALATLVLCPPAGAQELARSARIAVDNDYFDFTKPPRQRTDDNYTQGLRIAWDTPWVPRFARRVVCGEGYACGTTFELGQEMYTPTEDDYWPLPGERPYAGWLYARALLRGAPGGALRRVGLTIGVTGPLSLASAAQRALHRLTPEFRQPLGWDHQLPTEVAFVADAAQMWRVVPAGAAGRILDLVATAGASAGTLRTSATGGIRARVGIPLSHPWIRGPRPELGVHAFVGAAADLVGRDLFLQGSTFRRSNSVDPERLVGEWERGIGVRLGRLSFDYRAVTRSREYVTGPSSHTYGSLRLAWILN